MYNTEDSNTVSPKIRLPICNWSSCPLAIAEYCFIVTYVYSICLGVARGERSHLWAVPAEALERVPFGALEDSSLGPCEVATGETSQVPPVHPRRISGCLQCTCWSLEWRIGDFLILQWILVGFHHQKIWNVGFNGNSRAIEWDLMGCADKDVPKSSVFPTVQPPRLGKSKELCLMVPLDYDGVADATVRLMVSDSSKNGTWVNEQRLAKERFEELKDGHVLRIADVARYVPWQYWDVEMLQGGIDAGLGWSWISCLGWWLLCELGYSETMVALLSNLKRHLFDFQWQSYFEYDLGRLKANCCLQKVNVRRPFWVQWEFPHVLPLQSACTTWDLYIPLNPPWIVKLWFQFRGICYMLDKIRSVAGWIKTTVDQILLSGYSSCSKLAPTLAALAGCFWKLGSPFSPMVSFSKWSQNWIILGSPVPNFQKKTSN